MSKSSVFISYSRKDYVDENNNPISDSVVGQIVETLKSNNIDVWIDIKAHYSGKYFAEVLAQRIIEADKVIFISSVNSNSPETEWVEKELNFAIARKKKIIPIKIDKSPFNVGFELLLSGIDYVEYYKNPTLALSKVVTLLNEQQDEAIVMPSEKYKFTQIIKNLIIVSLVLLVVFAIFASIGFAVGYYRNRGNIEDLVEVAFRQGKFTVVDTATIRYSDELLSFNYNLNGCVTYDDNQIGFFENMTFEKAMMAVSVPIALKSVLKSSKYSGGGKAKVMYIIASSVGIIIGYGVGEPLGERYAQYENQRAVMLYFNKTEARARVQELLFEYYK